MELSWNYGSLERTNEVLKNNPVERVIYIQTVKQTGDALSIAEANALISNLQEMIIAAISE